MGTVSAAFAKSQDHLESKNTFDLSLTCMELVTVALNGPFRSTAIHLEVICVIEINNVTAILSEFWLSLVERCRHLIAHTQFDK
jgi:hypothetical protein